MNHFKFFLVAFLFIVSTVNSQTNEPIQSFSLGANLLFQRDLQHAINNNMPIHLSVEGEVYSIVQSIGLYSGKVKHIHGNSVSFLMPASKVASFLESTPINHLEYDGGKGQPLTNESVKHAKADLIRQGAFPLTSSYNGDGIILGFIDTGIEIDHDDFKDTEGNTRIIAIWDQGAGFDSTLTPSKFGYGQAWDSISINNGTCTHTDDYSNFGHGTNVAGIGAGNGNSVPDSIVDYSGLAPNSLIVAVASDFSASNWTSTVADAVEYIYHIGDSLNLPVVINASIGTITGSHDGLDAPARYIDSLTTAKKGRAFVCAAGNYGHYPAFHLGYQVTSDTNFTWFISNPNSGFGFNAVFYELWADTADFDSVWFSIGASDSSTFLLKGNTNYDQVKNRLNTLVTDSILDTAGNLITPVLTWAEQSQGRYLLQVLIQNPSQANYYDFITTGSGHFDVWSSNYFGYSAMVKTNQQSGRMQYYENPDTLQSIVSSWACSPNSITVANFTNRDSYLDMDSVLQTFSNTVGEIHSSSSRGPARSGIQKPDLAAPGDLTLATGMNQDLTALAANSGLRSFVGLGGKHRRVGGTSMASPVVAGVIALYLHKSPNASIDQIKAALLNNTVKDSLTGFNLPDVDWGYGKVDGFAALISSTPNVVIQYSDDSLVCPGEQVTVSTDTLYASYLWSTGDTTPTITVGKGFYSLTVTNSQGSLGYKDSIRVDSIPNPVVNLGTDSTFCQGDTVELTVASFASQIWSTGDSSVSIHVTQASSIWVSVTDSFSCTGSDSILFSVQSLPTPNLGADTTICQGDTLWLNPGNYYSYSWSTGDTVQQVPATHKQAFTVEVSDSIGCKGNTQIEILGTHSLPSINLGQDTAICTGDSIFKFLNPINSILWENGGTQVQRYFSVPGVYWAEVTNFNQCSRRDTFQIDSLYALPSFNLNNDTLHCAGQQVTFSGPANMMTYQWSNGAQSQNVQVSGQGSFILTVTDFNGCRGSDTASIFHVQPLPNVNLGTAKQFCEGDSLVVQAPIGNYFYWWNDSITISKRVFYYSDTVSLTVTDSLGCSASDQLIVIQNPLPVFDLGQDPAICYDSSAVLSGGGPLGMTTYEWSTGDTTLHIQFCFDPIVCHNLLFQGDNQHWLRVTDVNGCRFTDSLNIHVFPPVVLNLDLDTTLCADDSVKVLVDLSGKGYSTIYWTDGPVDSVRLFTQFGSYRVEVANSNGCVAADSLIIDSLPLPKFDFGPDTTLYPGDSALVLDPGILGNSYLWNTGDTSSSITVEVLSTNHGTYSLQVTDLNGCTYSDSIQVDIYLWSIIEQDYKNGITIAPNPVKEVAEITFMHEIAKTVTVRTISGKILAVIKPNRKTVSIDLARYTTGIYLVEIEYLSEKQTFKLIKE